MYAAFVYEAFKLLVSGTTPTMTKRVLARSSKAKVKLVKEEETALTSPVLALSPCFTSVTLLSSKEKVKPVKQGDSANTPPVLALSPCFTSFTFALLALCCQGRRLL